MKPLWPLLLLAASLAQGQDSKLAFSCGATRVPVILDRLSKQTGIQLRCNAALDDEVLFISVRDIGLSDLMDEIKDVTHASWEKVDGGFLLRRTPQQEAQDAKADAAINLSLLRKGLAKDIEQGRKRAWTPEEAQANFARLAEIRKMLAVGQISREIADPLYDEQRNRGVGVRAAQRVFAAIDLSTFADQLPWQRRTYVASPNQFQWKLPAAATATLRDFLAEEREIDARLQGLEKEARESVGQELGRYGLRFVPVGDSAHVMATTQIVGTHFMDIRVVFYDDDGALIDFGSRFVDLSPEPDLSAVDGIASWGTAQVSMTALAVGWAAGEYPGAPLSPEDLALVSHPMLHDPLGIVFDEPLTGLVKASNLDIVAALPDECAREMIKGKCTLTDFCTRLGHWESFRMHDGRLLLTPIRRGIAYSVRARRKALEDLFAVCAQHIPTLDDTSAYVLAQRDGAAVSGLESVLLAWNRCTRTQYEAMMGVGSDVGGYRSRLKFYGLLSTHDKDRMANGGMAFRDLTPRERALVDTWLFSGDSTLFVVLDPAEQEAYRKRMELVGPPMFDRDPIYMMPGGVPEDSIVTLKIVQTRAAHVISPTGRRQIEDCIDLGYILSQQERGEWLDPTMGYPNVATSKMAPAWQRQINFVLQFERRLSDRFSLADATMVNSTYGPYGQLPSEWLKPLNDTLESYRKYFKSIPAEKQSTPPPANG